MAPFVQVSGLRIVARDGEGAAIPIVDGVDFEIAQGEVLALIGESGSGKTTIALSLMGYARAGLEIVGGSVRIGEIEVLALDREARTRLRGNTVAYIAQSAAAAFNPSRTIIDQVVEPALIHGLMDRPAAEAKAIALFRALALPDPETIGRRYPHQVSGGQLQRLIAAMALITDPAVVILDEPTTALDVTTQIEVLRAFKKAVAELGTTAIYVSHDLAVVAQMADHILVLQQGVRRETGGTDQVLHAPRDDYTRSLMAASRPAVQEAPPEAASDAAPLLEVRGLAAGYGRAGADGLPGNLVLHDVDLIVRRGSTLGVIGESGSGKSTLARVIAGLVPSTRGEVLLGGEPLPPGLAKRSREQFRRIQIVFQNADTALNPAHTVERVLERPVEFYHGLSGVAKRRRVAELLDLTRLPAAVAGRRCGALSGGQKQRINLARALAAEPDIILCDEVTSALDTVVGAAILELLADLRRELGLAYVFISHDISTVRAICDEVMVLYSGRAVDVGPRDAYRQPPYHPYTNLLIASVPEMRRGWLEDSQAAAASAAVGGEVPASKALCPFLPRCPVRIAGVCDVTPPPERLLEKGNTVLCHLEEPDLRRAQGVSAAARASA
jgi:peptide/nickel transport system ATP-binding protein